MKRKIPYRRREQNKLCHPVLVLQIAKNEYIATSAIIGFESVVLIKTKNYKNLGKIIGSFIHACGNDHTNVMSTENETVFTKILRALRIKSQIDLSRQKSHRIWKTCTLAAI